MHNLMLALVILSTLAGCAQKPPKWKMYLIEVKP